MYKLVNLNGSLACIQYQVGNVLYSIPVNPDNADYQAYLAWVAEGNEPLPADEENTQ